MIKEFVDAWDKNKGKLEEYFKTHKQSEYDGYESLVKLLFEVVINPEYDGDWTRETFDTTKIHRIDDGDYQGTLIFLIPKDTYQPSVEEYVYTSVYYGSCSGCDTLQWIQSFDYNELPSENQVKEYMTLCLHLLQHCKMLTEEDSEA